MSTDVRPGRETIDRRAVAVVQILDAHRHSVVSANRGEGAFVSAADLASQIGLPSSMGHETRRRRIREAVTRAREMLREQGAADALVASGAGYAMTGDAALIRSWIEDRRRAGLTDLVEVGLTQRSVAVDAATGQYLLFPTQPQYRI